MTEKQIAIAPPQAMAPIDNGLDAVALISKAIEHKVDINTMERLLAMRDKLKAEQARRAFYLALSNFQGDCPIIAKTKTVTVTTKSGSTYQYSYAPLDIIVQTVGPILQKHGLSFTVQTKLEKEPVSQVASCTIHHIDGHSESSEFRAPVDEGAGMNGMQKAASAQTYAKRYAFCNALGILTGDDDDDGNGAIDGDDDKPAPKQKLKVSSKKKPGDPKVLGKVKSKVADFKAKFEECESLPDLAEQFKLAQREIKSFKTKIPENQLVPFLDQLIALKDARIKILQARK